MDADTPKIRTQAPRAEPPPTPTEAELSRIAREAVHQPADARLDKQLARMGLIDSPEGTDVATGAGRPAAPAVVIDPELARLRSELGRMRSMLLALVGVIVVLAIALVALLVR